MESANPLQQLLLRGLGTTTLVADRLRYVTQEWVSSGRLDSSHASALVDDVLKALRGDTPELEQQMGRNLERNRDNLLQDLGLASQRELDELRGRIDRLEQQLRQRERQD
ncbi:MULTISPECIES: phasin family protein [unclassified Synechococcus]|jgi:polyhydroxyalkanoate synthesis regulator phasin|uniref:phasin family protein n=1 Tax=unclassified Synechococcus TaxID=2626047 RepID=UPI000C8A1238|nr:MULTISPECIES: hypothetical protein [unclassified Synechococcus]MAS27154.1 hypothetical protein [Synechococcus sp. NAT40]RZO14412.1 MAG: hypothetical protein EVB08_03165 [Synechococcus sp. MED-G135]|tara:strand:- start:120 stop:449 length:330 start_codon:yes stop_codon:yes gene_type:complete